MKKQEKGKKNLSQMDRKIKEYSKKEIDEIVKKYWGKIDKDYSKEQVKYIVYCAICKKEFADFCKMREKERKKEIRRNNK